MNVKMQNNWHKNGSVFEELFNCIRTSTPASRLITIIHCKYQTNYQTNGPH